MSEVEGHSNEAEFIQETVEFLLEHTSLPGREDVKLKAADFSHRYGDLLKTLKTYVGNLEVNFNPLLSLLIVAVLNCLSQESVPLWNEFNAVSQEFGEWLDHAHLQLTSDLTQPGNAIVTETSLRNVEVCPITIEGGNFSSFCGFGASFLLLSAHGPPLSFSVLIFIFTSSLSLSLSLSLILQLLQEELAGHEGTLDTLRALTESLSQLIPSEDKVDTPRAASRLAGSVF